MPFLLLLILTVACLPGKWPEAPAWLGPGGCLLFTWAGTALLVGLAGVMARFLCRRLIRDPGERPAVLRRYGSLRYYHLLGLLTFYLTALYSLGWTDTVRRHLFDRSEFPGVELLILAPFLLGLVLSWALFYDVEQTVRGNTRSGDGRSFPSRWSFVGVQTRFNLILVCPPLLLMIVQQLIVGVFPDLGRDWIFPALSVGLLVALFLGIPWILRLWLGLKPLPEGPLRDRLLAAARRLNFRCRDILLWNTRHGVANAMVTGLLPSLRYVVVTDRLLTDLTPDEIEAVFGHEVGHVKHHHLLFYFVFLLLSMVAVAGVWEAGAELLSQGGVQEALQSWLPGVTDWVDADEVVAVLPLLTALGAYIFLVFGFLSRRCERQADIYGCRAVSCGRAGCFGHGGGAVPAPLARGLCPTGIRIFVEALEKVARVNGISRDRPGWLSSWQHSTIALRVEFLQRMSTEPGLEAHFQRRVGLVKWGLFLGLGATFATVTLVLGVEGVWKLLRTL
jgi:Zn-dependent protease with chaperone function